jgi:hypothetical protein
MIFNTTTGCPNYYYAGLWYEWCGREGLSAGVIEALDCAAAVNMGSITIGEWVEESYSLINYEGGNGGIVAAKVFSSEGVIGLTASMSKDTLVEGNGFLRINISGIAMEEGQAFFPLRIGRKSCILVWEIIPYQEPAYPLGTIHCDPENITIVKPVLNPQTGRVWMDRNLGANRVAQSIDDEEAFGDLYQWGRFGDGHQCRNSNTTLDLSTTDQPEHGKFILAINALGDWREGGNDGLWAVETGINNPCPEGYRLPTALEFEVERLSWSQNNRQGAFESPLRFPSGGVRLTNGTFFGVSQRSGLWSSTTNTTAANVLFLNELFAGESNHERGSGYSVRCIKN